MAKTDLEPGESMDNTLELTMEIVKEKAVKGIVVLTGRTFFLQLFSLFVTVYLWAILDPADVGVYGIVSAVVNFLTYFADIGLGAALIQSKTAISDTDLKTTFVVQQGIVLSLIAVLFVAAPYLANYYNLDRQGVVLMYALGASFLMASLKTIPSVLLERELEFFKWTLPQIVETIVFNSVVLFMAWKGYGVASYTYAVISRGLVGLTLIYILKPWMPGFAFSRDSIRKLLKFGVPYQANSFLASIKDDGLTAFLGGILGSTQMGYLIWAKKWINYPLRLFMDNVLKVTFPAFSRMQGDKKQLGSSVTRSIFFLCFLIFPSVVGIAIISPILVDMYPKYHKWIPALIPLYVFTAETIFSTITTQLTNTLNAIGRVTTTFRLMIMWTVLAWLVIPYVAINYGYIGASIGYVIVSSSSVIAIMLIKRYIDFSLKDAVLAPAISTTLMAITLLLIRMRVPYTLNWVVVLVVLGAGVYMMSMRLLIGERIVADVKKLTKNLYTRS